MRTLYLCGAGNSEGVRLAMILNKLEDRWDRLVVLDDDPKRHGAELIGVPIEGSLDTLKNANPETDEVVNLVARVTKTRKKVRDRILSYGIPFAPLIHPNVDLYGATMDDDVIIYQNVTIGPEVSLGPGCVVFMGAIVGHECRAAECCVMAANSVLNARVILDDCVYIGTNSTTVPEMKIGAGAIIGAGSVIMFDIPAGATAIGVPAEIFGGPEITLTDYSTKQIHDTVVAIWQELLNTRSIDEQTSFFDLGGDSLLALQMRHKLRNSIGADLAVTDIFRFPTIRTLSARLAGEEAPVAAAVSAAQTRGTLRAQAMRTRRRVH
jgi:sugar O-acyltransferase (sialic acid O-acetyltransferase NeuD family)